MTEKIGVGLWGVGAHARRTVLPALSQTPGIDLVGLTSRNAEAAVDQAWQWNCLHWTSPGEMLRDDRVQAIFVATPTGLHAEHGMQVIEAGRHLWSEKALTVTLSETEALATAAKRRGVGLCTVCGPLYHFQFKALLDLISSDKIGALKHISAEFGFPHLESGNIRYRRDLGGGALLDLGTYLLALTARLAGAPPSDLRCTIETDVGYEVDTSGAAILSFANGIEAKLDWGYGRPYCNALILSGELGSARVSPAFSKPEGRSFDIVVRYPDREHAISIPDCDQFVEMLKVFADSIGDAALIDRLRNDSVAQQELIEKTRCSAA